MDTPDRCLIGLPLGSTDKIYGCLSFGTNKYDLNVIVGKPDMVSNCSVNNVSVNSFTVRCLEGFNGGLPQTFSVVVKEDEDQNVANSSSREPWFTISGLQPGTWHRIFVYSANVKGHSEPYVLEVVTLGKRIPPADSTIEGNQPGKVISSDFLMTYKISS